MQIKVYAVMLMLFLKVLYGTLLKKGEDKNIEEIINIQDSISAPISKSQKLGEISYVLNGETIGKANLIAENDVKKNRCWDIYGKVILFMV